jgi:acyl homoserine lactone synthase
MIRLITAQDRGTNLAAIMAMYRLRHRVFKLRLDWEVMTSGGMEVDEFDTMHPVYVLHETDEGAIDGCVRLLPTTGPYMLREVFPALLGAEPAPVGTHVWEASRFACEASDGRSARALAKATFELFAGVLEFGLSWGLTELVVVVDTRFERILRLGRWPLCRLGVPYSIGRVEATAGHLEVSPAVLARVRTAAGIDQPVLGNPYSAVA